MTDEKPTSIESTEWDSQIYIGKELKRKGSNDKGEWKLFKLKFDTGREYPFAIDCFSTVGTKTDSKSLQIKDLEEGEWYKFGYNKKTNAFNAHGKWHENRTCFFIQKTTEEEAKKQQEEKNNNTKEKKQKNQQLTHEEVDKLYEKLQSFDIQFQKKLCDENKEEQYNIEQFMSSYYLNNHKAEAKVVMSYWTANNENKSKAVKENEKDPEKKKKTPTPSPEDKEKEIKETNDLAKEAVKIVEMNAKEGTELIKKSLEEQKGVEGEEMVTDE